MKSYIKCVEKKTELLTCTWILMDFEILTILNDNADVFYIIDAALVLLWTTSVGCVCLRASEAWMQLDVRLDCFLCRSCHPGK